MNKPSRRQMLMSAGRGLSAVALAGMLEQDGLLPKAQAAAVNPLAPKPPHFTPKAHSVIWLHMHGAPATIDLFDYKPDLIRLAGQPVPDSFGKIELGTAGGRGPLLATKRTWKQYGQSGAWFSDWLPNLAQKADDLCFIKSKTEGSTHIICLYRCNTGALTAGRPSMGAWTLYGLGSANQDLPGFVVLTDNSGGIGEGRGVVGGVANWSSGFLPAVYQGTALRQGDSPILDLQRPGLVGANEQRATLDLLKNVNQHYGSKYPTDDELEARIESYELAYRMQVAAPEAVDLSKESEATKKLYGLDDDVTTPYGTNLLRARRLVERGVRFIQVYSGQSSSWDAHHDIEQNHGQMSKIVDKPVAGLLTDLKSRGLLDTTLVVWTAEFGRTPYSQSGDGRDHNPWGFTSWLAGGGIKAGIVYGETDAIGLRAISNPVDTHDLNATILNQLGLNHVNLTFLHEGRSERPTVVYGHVVKDILA
jgi:Protein of unknown function (DUF1501)